MGCELGWGQKSEILASVLLNTEKNIFYWKGPNKRLPGIKNDVYVKYQSVLEVHRIQATATISILNASIIPFRFESDLSSFLSKK